MSARRERRGLGSAVESGSRGGRGTEAVGVTWARAGPASAKWLEVRRVIHGRAKGCATLRVRPAAAARERKPRREHLSPPRNREHPARSAPPTTTTRNVTRERAPRYHRNAIQRPRPPRASGSRECPVSRVPGPVAGSRRGRRLASCTRAESCVHSVSSDRRFLLLVLVIRRFREFIEVEVIVGEASA